MNHEELVANLKKDPEEIFLELSHSSLDAMHMCLGLAGEAGEVVDVVKKHTMYNKALDRGALVEELGDLEFYLEGLRQTFDISRREVLEVNINKLTKRYGDKYSNAAAIDRADKD